MKDIFLLCEVYAHNEHGQHSHPYVVRSGFGAAARRLIKKGLVIPHPTKDIIALATLTEKGELALRMMQGMLGAL